MAKIIYISENVKKLYCQFSDYKDRRQKKFYKR